MNSVFNILYLLGGAAGLYFGAEFLVKGGSAIARKAGISPLVIGLTLVAFATSAPEFVVSVGAAWEGNGDISLGNIVGSNICNIALILGICACIAPMSVQRQLLRFDAPVMLASAILLTIFYFCSDGLNRIQGAIFFAGLIAYTWYCIRLARREPEIKEKDGEKRKSLSLTAAILFVVIGFAALVGGAKIFVWGAVYFARIMNLSDAVIGLTVIAVGTSLPELATSVVAAAKRENDIAIGNVLGSNIFNVLGILGVSPLVRPLSNVSIDPIDMGVMLLCSICLLPIMRTGWKISRKEGVFFLIVYAGYTAYLIMKHA